MNQEERPIEDLLGELPEPERSEALEARRKAVERGGYYGCIKTANSKTRAIVTGFDWIEDGGDIEKWSAIFERNQNSEHKIIQKAIKDEEGRLLDYFDFSNALSSLKATINLAVRDWSVDHRDAWIYGIIVGWSEEAITSVAKIHGWTKEDLEVLKRHHSAFDTLKMDLTQRTKTQLESHTNEGNVSNADEYR